VDRREDSFDLRAALRVLRRRAGLIGLCFALVAGSALVFSLLQEKQYSATASLLFRDPGFDQRVLGVGGVEQPDPERAQATNLRLVSLDVVAERTADDLGGGVTGGEVSSKVDVGQESGSDLVSLTATDSDPEFAAELANEFGANFVKFRRKADRRAIRDAQRLVENEYAALDPAEAQSQQGEFLRKQVSRLETLEALQTGNAEVVQEAEPPTSPSEPNVRRNFAFGAVLGLLLGLGLALLLERLDRRLKDPQELEESFSLPILGTVPETERLARREEERNPLPVMESQVFRMLRTRLRYFNVDRDVRSVLVTSPGAGDGKSTISWYLALTAAQAGSRALLIETDFHRQQLAEQRGLSALPGLAEVVTRQATLEQAIQKVQVEDRSNGEEPDRYVDVLVAGASPPNPIELMESEEMAKLMAVLTEGYDLVVIDTPPMAMIADPIPLMKLVTGVIVIAQLHKTTRDEANHLAGQFERLGAPVLGVIANRARRRGQGYGYYGYGYYSGYGEDGAERKGKRLRIPGLS
jgi:succinoglycan biosynthesis transport protein ExoP